jgi:hypothetical protein
MAGRRLALIVATDEYADPGLRKLRAPAKDAEALAGVLADHELGDFEVDVLRNGTNSAIAERVETLLSGGKTDDLIVLHFSCHGLKDDSGELFLAATNTRPDLLASTAVDAALVNRLMRRSRAQRVVLFLDCCYGGAFERGMMPRAAGVVDVADQFQQQEQELSGGRGRVVITASNAMEFAFEGADLADTIATEPSVFTGALVEGLTTGAADRDQDGLVSLGELYDYVFERVRLGSPNQTPGKWEFGLQGDLVLAKNPQRVIVPAPLPHDLLELVDHPFPATRLGSVDVLTRLAEGSNLPIAAGARSVLERMVNDDSRAVAAAASEAVAAMSLRLSAADVDLGNVPVGAAATAEISIEGPPLATASRVESSTPALRVRRIDRTVRIDADTSAPGPVDGVVTVAGPAGSAEVHVVGAVSAAASASSAPVARPSASAPAVAVAVEPKEPAPSEPAQPTTPPPRVPDLPASEPSEIVTDTERESFARRAALRGFLGVMIGDVLATFVFWFTHQEIYTKLDDFGTEFRILVLDAVLFPAAVAAAEWFLPAIRVPDGAAYRAIRGHRVRTAAVQGAVVGSTVGFITYLIAVGGSILFVEALLLLPTAGAVGFAVAEALLRSRDRPT